MTLKKSEKAQERETFLFESVSDIILLIFNFKIYGY